MMRFAAFALGMMLPGCGKDHGGPVSVPPPGAVPVAGDPEIRDLGIVNSSILGYGHRVQVYLPPGYGSGLTRYPVLYMQDGQSAFGGSNTMQLDQVATNLAKAYVIRPLIIVAVHAATPAAARVKEFTPGDPTGGALYARMIVEELKPAIDAQFRTLTGPDDTGVMGHSLGGVISWHMALTFPGTFHLLASQSGTLSGRDTLMIRTIRDLPAKIPLRVWYDRGTSDGEEKHRALEAIMRQTLLDKGWVEGTDFRYLLVQGGTHSVSSWKQRADPILRFLFGK